MSKSSEDKAAGLFFANELQFLRIVVLLFYAIVLIRTAWLSDDGFITFRTIDNFLQGHGLRWNISERVQTYTHPLWMLLLIIPHALSGEAFWSTHIVSMGISLLVMGLLLWKITATPGQVLLLAISILLCNSYLDYSTSGLENPLTHLLIVCFLLYLKRCERTVNLRLGSLLLALCILTRHDLLLIILPAFLYCIDWKSVNKKTIFDIAIGLLPLVVWEVFSLIYYGFPVPNTAYAKLGAGLPKETVIAMGFNYLAASFVYDPLPLATIGTAILVALFGGSNKLKVLAVGAGLYTAYIVWAGGDFMAGRFLTAPFLVSLAIIVERVALVKNAYGVLPWVTVCIAIGAFFTPTPTLWTSTEYNQKTEDFPWTNGVCSERSYYYPYTSLLRNFFDDELGRQSWVRYGKEVRARGKRTVHTYGAIGFRGYFGGPDLHLVDYNALCDPLLARLPGEYPAARPGHLKRAIPAGYVRSLKTGRNLIGDESLSTYYGVLQQITREPLLSYSRFEAIVGMNFGRYKHLLDTEYFTYPTAVHKSLERVSRIVRRGAPWNAHGNTMMKYGGVFVALDETSHAAQIELSLDLNDSYRIRFFMDDTLIDDFEVGPSLALRKGMEVYVEPVPSKAMRAGYNRIHILPVDGDKRFSMGHVVLREAAE